MGRYAEAYDSAVERQSRQCGDGTALPEAAMECYVCECLGVTPLELAQLSEEQVATHLAWADGKGLAEWVGVNPWQTKR